MTPPKTAPPKAVPSRHENSGSDARTDTGSDSRVPFSVCYAGGGTFGIAWHLAVTEALTEAGMNPAGAPLVGTSAGSWAAPSAKLGIGFEEFAALADTRLPDPRPGVLWKLASRLFGAETRTPGVTVAAVELPTMRRRLFDGAEYPAADLAAASSAVPGLFAPHRVGGRWCIDGGVRSMASVDIAPAAELLIVSLPVAGSLLGPVGRSLEVTSRRMIRGWRARHGGVSIVLRPSRQVTDEVGSDPRALFDVERAFSVYPDCLEVARRRIALRLDQIAAMGVSGTSRGPRPATPRSSGAGRVGRRPDASRSRPE